MPRVLGICFQVVIYVSVIIVLICNQKVSDICMQVGSLLYPSYTVSSQNAKKKQSEVLKKAIHLKGVS
jgi:hypothetical protein